MIPDLNANSEKLTDKDKTSDIIFEIYVKLFNKHPSFDIMDAIDELACFYENGIVDASPNVALNVALLNTESIFQLAESPIEKIFLNTLNIISFPYNDICIFLTPQVQGIEEAKFMESIEMQKSLLQIWQNFRKGWEDNSARVFMALLNEMDFLTKGQRARVIWYIVHEYIAKIYGIFYVTLQPTIKNILPNNKAIRPDIYIWHPYASSFKLIIECDGYAYHSDKASFSKDRARDRLLHMKGFKVLRFSGHDILDNPIHMAKELQQYLIEQKKEIKPIFLE